MVSLIFRNRSVLIFPLSSKKLSLHSCPILSFGVSLKTINSRKTSSESIRKYVSLEALSIKQGEEGFPVHVSGLRYPSNVKECWSKINVQHRLCHNLSLGHFRSPYDKRDFGV